MHTPLETISGVTISRRVAGAALSVALLTMAQPTHATEFGPQGIVRQFCQSDALGERVTISSWPQIAPLVEWSLEPAWDHVMLIAGYTVDPPRSDGKVLAVDVYYSVVGTLSARGLSTESRVDHVTYRVHAPDEHGWRIIGPPPPPYIFGGRIDVAVMRRSLEQGAAGFLSNSAFVWQMFRRAGWKVGFERTLDMLSSGAYRSVEQPVVGDVVAYFREQSPYHVGILEADNRVVSSTLNAGVVRTPLDAFAGDVQYLRLVDPNPEAHSRQAQIETVQDLSAPSASRRRAARPKVTPQRGAEAAPTPRAPRPAHAPQ